MEDEEYFEAEEEKKEETGDNLENKKSWENGDGNLKENRRFLIDDHLSGSESDTNSEADFSLAKDNLQRIRNKLSRRKIEGDEEEKIATFNSHKGLSRTASLDKISNKIDIQLHIKSMSEDSDSQLENGHQQINSKRIGSDLETEEDIREESKLEPQKRLKL